MILYAIELIIQWFEFIACYGDYQWWSRQCWSQYQTTPRTPHTAPILSTEQSATSSATPPMSAEGAADVAPPTTDAAEEGVDAGLDRDVDAFPGSSRVTSTGSIVCKFLVNEELVPIKIERIPGHYRLFNLVFIICV